MTAWKLFTSDLCPPVQGGPPVWDGSTPYVLPPVEVEYGPNDCGAGYNYCESLAKALRIAGLWPNGRPSRAFLVEPLGGFVNRGDKSRAESLHVIREATPEEILEGLREFSKAFGKHGDVMAYEQEKWRNALARPSNDATAAADGLARALEARGLKWSLRKFATARAARDAWVARDAWDAWVARDAWDAWVARAAWVARVARDARAAWVARDARAAWVARDARAAWVARDARDAWDARAAWVARDAWDAWDAWDALSVSYASRMGWTKDREDLLSVGIRDAYAAGLDIAIPTGPNELGFAMTTQQEKK